MVNEKLTLALASASLILEAFEAFQSEFKIITHRARVHFEQRDWHTARQDAIERLGLYKKVIDYIVIELEHSLGDNYRDLVHWKDTKATYSEIITGKDDIELAETFFNSVTRRVFTTIGVDPHIEYVDTDFEIATNRPEQRIGEPVFTTYTLVEKDNLDLSKVILAILNACPFNIGYHDKENDALIVSSEIEKHLTSLFVPEKIERIEVLKPVFYRDNYAFLIGRLILRKQARKSTLPLAISLISTSEGVGVDAVLLDEDEVSIVFSFAHSYFHVEIEKPYAVVRFLKSIIPLKRIAELYISIGYNKHGKTELYRDLMRHMANSADRFEIARGEKGMVMVVFTLPSYDIVFKVIKDRVTPPKAVSRSEVMERYDLVFKHDRVGRLVDAQEFEYLRFERQRFTPELLEELLEYAPDAVSFEEDFIVLKHVYTERRLTPLNLFIREASQRAANDAVLDYGQAIKDLAAVNIFPGDVLLKNFGVTRHGRIVFYDYDELCLVTDCKFRLLPEARDFDDEFASEPWFYVGPNDIFPQEFRTFLGLPEPLNSTFKERHSDLFKVEFWRQIQAKHAAGHVMEIFPYPANKHLKGP